jgi:hypothetical protein
MADHRRDCGILGLGEHLGAVCGVALDNLELLVGEPAGLVEDLPRRVNLAHVVHRGGEPDLRDLLG